VDVNSDESVVTCTRRGLDVEVARDVSVPADVASTALRDVQTWTAWSPLIDGVESDDRYVSEGTRGRVRVAGVWLSFRVTAFNGRRWDWTVSGLPATGHRVEAYAGDPNRCRVVFEVPLPAAGYVPTCERALERFARLLELDAIGGDGEGVVDGTGETTGRAD